MQKQVSIVGVPMDLGQAKRGVDMGPAAIRYADVVERLMKLGYDVEDFGDLEVERTQKENSCEKLKNLHAVAETNRRLAELVSDIVSQKRFPLILGGDHSIAIGTIAGISKYYERLGVIWFDAHGDLNTKETSPSGNIHGMPLAVNLGYGEDVLINLGNYSPKIKPEHVTIIGARSLDEGEKELIHKLGINVYTMHEVDRLGMAAIMEEVIDYFQKHADGIHISFDLDCLDPLDAPGVGTPVLGGLTYRESHLAMEMLAEADLVTSAEFVEVNPILDERNKTARTAVALIGSLFGEKLL